MAAFTWGDTVRVKKGLKPGLRPGAVAEVVGFRDVETKELAQQLDVPVGSRLYLIEFGDGEAIEIPHACIEAASVDG